MLVIRFLGNGNGSDVINRILPPVLHKTVASSEVRAKRQGISSLRLLFSLTFSLSDDRFRHFDNFCTQIFAERLRLRVTAHRCRHTFPEHALDIKIDG
jgi:hypothetical protein